MTKHSPAFALAGMILGIISICTCFCLYISIPCGAIGLILSILSRGGEMTYPQNAKIGMILASIGIALTIIIYIGIIIYSVVILGSDTFMQQFQQNYYPHYGYY